MIIHLEQVIENRVEKLNSKINALREELKTLRFSSPIAFSIADIKHKVMENKKPKIP